VEEERERKKRALRRRIERRPRKRGKPIDRRIQNSPNSFKVRELVNTI
jgi:hypothetical protein